MSGKSSQDSGDLNVEVNYDDNILIKDDKTSNLIYQNELNNLVRDL